MKAQTTLAGVILRAVVILGLMFSLVPPAGAQMSSARGKAALAKLQAATAAKPAGGTQEGIKVHGHWTIVVRDEKGKEVERREFDNSLQLPGANMLVALLNRNGSMGHWIVTLHDSNISAPQSCATPMQPDRVCGIYENLQTAGGGGTGTFPPGLNVFGISDDLRLMSPTGPPQLVLHGTTKIGLIGPTTIDKVRTWISACPPTFAPSTPCGYGNFNHILFSEAGPSAFQPVVLPATQFGRLVEIFVVFTFS